MEVEDDEEEEDMDLNPFLREATPSEASSSLTSENEDIGTNADKNGSISTDQQGGNAKFRSSEGALCCALDNGPESENVVRQARLLTEDGHGMDAFLDNYQHADPTSFVESGKELASGAGIGAADDLEDNELLGKTTGTSSQKISGEQAPEIDAEDAICKRTRARYSLANTTLEELEAFLQESDDKCELQNVNEEEEYHKFLAAVLMEGGDGRQDGQGDENLDEDENDADFEAEIEAALESDVDETIHDNKAENDECERDANRPETRQKKRLKESAEKNKNCLRQPKIPLRPILPFVSHAQPAPVPAYGWQFPSSKGLWPCPSSSSGADMTNGFTAQQIGQLYVLIHEHVQLLIQVFSVCVLEPSRRQVASEVQKLMMEMVTRREEALTRRKIPYPESCFGSPYIYSSLNANTNQGPGSSCWMPLIDNPIASVLDVPPLQLANNYLNDVALTVWRHRQCCLDNKVDQNHSKREPLFPLPAANTPTAPYKDCIGGYTKATASPLSPRQLQPKKSLAASLLESTKNQSVALVPADIARLAQKFFPLFNLALFPHRPPMLAVANRALFTDAEDGLLAMGLMEYNNDWGAIQKRFLPCKSKNQIFVRQKNRSSSKAPENPIKAVRRMKSSPLTLDEKARIYEGLKLFKHDWLSIWKYFVPHRDPSLLPRQWRIATGTQKSYSKSEALKEKRRLYEAKRRRMKASMDIIQTLPGKEYQVDNEASCADEVESNEDEAYIHEAFLVDSENRSSGNVMPNAGTCAAEKSALGIEDSGGSWQGSASRAPLDLVTSSMHGVAPNTATSVSTSKPSGSCKVPFLPLPGIWKGARIVKLAPNLPPVNLPCTVRVISRMAFQGYQSRSSCSNISTNESKDICSSHPVPATENTCSVNPPKQLNLFPDNGNGVSQQEDIGIPANMTKDNSGESDFHMHPLLFQASGDRYLFYSTKHPANALRTYNFLWSSKDQVNHSVDMSQYLVQKTDQISNSCIARAPGDMHTIDFHPLLQRAGGTSTEGVNLPSCSRVFNDPREGDRQLFVGQPDCNVGESTVASGQASSDRNSNENNLDLEINLFSAVTNKTTRLDGRDTVEDPHANSSTSNAELANDCAGQCVEEIREEFMQGIVMELEELSDSDDASEHVEFEREEMDDSEEDELETVETSGTENKGTPVFAVMGGVPAIDDQHQVHELGSVRLGLHQEKRHFPWEKWQGGSFHAKLSAGSKPRRENTKRETSALQSHAHQSYKPRAKSSKMPPAGARQLHPQADSDSKDGGASKKPRKSSTKAVAS